MAAHLPHLLQASGLTLAAAVAVSALVGPAQVAARLMEFGLLRKTHPLISAQLAAIAHPIGAACMMIRSEEHTSELQSLMRNSYAVFCLKKKKRKKYMTKEAKNII